MSSQKLLRYHTDIFYPNWFNESINIFTSNLIGKQLVCSYHATNKYNSFTREYKKVVRDLLATVDLELSRDYIFEFSANKENEIKKVCYRFSTELLYDLILVVSSNAKIVTMFLNKSIDPHLSLDRSIYEKGE